MKIYSIYKATNILTGKSYIGLDQRWPRRKSSHKHSAKSDSDYYFHRAIRKYGFDNFTWEILYESEDKDSVVDAEIFYIKLFNTFGKHGYNRNAGGGGMAGGEHSLKTRQKISLSKRQNPCKPWLGKNRDDETKRKIAEKNKLYIQTEDQKRKNSDAIKQKWQDPVWREKMLLSRRKKYNVSSL